MTDSTVYTIVRLIYYLILRDFVKRFTPENGILGLILRSKNFRRQKPLQNIFEISFPLAKKLERSIYFCYNIFV